MANMNQRFDIARNVYLDVDENGVVRQLLHTHAPVAVQAATSQLAAATYLEQFRELLGVTFEQLKNLGLSPSKAIEDSPVEYRFSTEKHQFDSSTVAYYQTELGIPVWEAGLAVQMKKNPFRILSSQSTMHPDLKVKAPSKEKVKQAEALNEEELGRLIGLGAKSVGSFSADRKSLKIEDRSLMIYRYESTKRVPSGPQKTPPLRIANTEQNNEFAMELPTLPLKPVPDRIKDGQHYVSVKMDFELAGQPYGLLHWVAMIEVETLTILYLRAFVDHVNGMVFEIDPVTTNGGPMPTGNNAALNPVRVSDVLPGLVSPVAGTQSLTGDNVQLSDVELPTVAPPTEAGGTDFNFDARTDNFSAVNAYYHSDKFFRLLDGMGFTRTGFFGATIFPTPVDHRGLSGNVINAHCLGNTGGAGILQTAFALADTADTTNPLGIAGDYRVVLHELGGHGVLYNHVNSANFQFSHSAGDSIAAILNDPASQAADRFQTFPWLYNVVNRRHDRTPSGGWGYAGNIGLNPFSSTYDSYGYNNEQILSSAHFRLYRAIGGDSPDLPTRQFAARMAVYLIIRAIATLTPSTSPADAGGWVGALITADLGDWVSENITGGAYSKVIRWAFEKQGLFQPSGKPTPNNDEGAPPAVDVYIDDGRGGEYQYQPNWWSCQKIWNRQHNDGGTIHEVPITNQTNYAYVKVKNRGTQNATSVMVKAFHANPSAGLSYPIDWSPMSTPQLAAVDVPANNAGEVTVGPFEWIPTHVGHECIFMIVSAAGDESNVNNIAVGDSIPEWRLVPNDNNIGQRNVFPISGGGTTGLVSDFNRLTYLLKNPHRTTAAMEVRSMLPSFLEKRGWKIQFLNPGGSHFPLGPGESREMVIRVIPGADFGPADVPSTSDKTIELYGYAGGILVGGMSYPVDPNLNPFVPGGAPQGKECVDIGEQLLKCIEVSRGKVCRVRIRKVNVDLEITDESDGC